jgi:UDP-N-acetylglucosamine 2-epimerase (non-hydrolysing)
MKIASIVAALDAYNPIARTRIDYLLIHRGQQYDEKMCQTFFRELEWPRQAVDLEVGS